MGYLFYRSVQIVRQLFFLFAIKLISLAIPCLRGKNVIKQALGFEWIK